jgi:hypothetical protein
MRIGFPQWRSKILLDGLFTYINGCGYGSIVERTTASRCVTYHQTVLAHQQGQGILGDGEAAA